MPPDAPANLEGCVEAFLGADICNNPIVQGMRISQAEKEQLDRPITLDELDNALKTSNKKSAPGIDGVNNKLITIIWGLVRKPLLKCAEYDVLGKVSSSDSSGRPVSSLFQKRVT